MRTRLLTAASISLVTVAAMGSVPAPAREPVARLAAQRFFHSPSGKIECELDYHQAGIPTSAYCESITAQKTVTMDPGGHLRICGSACLSDGPENASTLAYGQLTRLGPFSCRSLVSGMRCRVPSGHGFLISRTGVKRL